jgi:hypothetical protein
VRRSSACRSRLRRSTRKNRLPGLQVGNEPQYDGDHQRRNDGDQPESAALSVTGRQPGICRGRACPARKRAAPTLALRGIPFGAHGDAQRLLPIQFLGFQNELLQVRVVHVRHLAQFHVAHVPSGSFKKAGGIP